MEASKAAGVKHMVLVSSIGTDEPIANPANIFWGILFWKKRAEEHLQRSGLPYTIVRPGGLVTDEVDMKDSKKRRKGKKSSGKGAVVMGRAGTYGFPPKKSGAILRSTVRFFWFWRLLKRRFGSGVVCQKHLGTKAWLNDVMLHCRWPSVLESLWSKTVLSTRLSRLLQMSRPLWFRGTTCSQECTDVRRLRLSSSRTVLP